MAVEIDSIQNTKPIGWADARLARLSAGSISTPMLTMPAINLTLGSTNYAKFQGTGTYLTTIGHEDGISAIQTNGWITINGNSVTDPLEHEIAGQNSYMLGISSDIADDPVIVIKGSTGNIFEVYDGGDDLQWSIATDGSASFGDTNSIFWIGKNITSNAGLKFNNGRIESFFGGETYPRFQVHNNGYFVFSLDGATATAANAVKVGIKSAATGALYASNGSNFVETCYWDATGFWVGQNVASTAGVKTTNGQVQSFYGGEANPRYQINNNGYLLFSPDGSVGPATNAIKVGLKSAGVGALYASDSVNYAEVVNWDASTTSSNTGLLLLVDGSIKRVVLGAADSGGTGYRMLRVVN